MKQSMKEFIRGYACCSAFLVRGHNEDTLAKESLDAGGIKRKDLMDARVDGYDLEVLLPLYKVEGGDDGKV